MKMLSIGSIVAAFSLALGACGSNDDSAPDNAPGSDEAARQGDNSTTDRLSDGPAQDFGPTTDGLGSPNTDNAPQVIYEDEPPAVPPLPKSKFLDSIGRALGKGVERMAQDGLGGTDN